MKLSNNFHIEYDAGYFKTFTQTTRQKGDNIGSPCTSNEKYYHGLDSLLYHLRAAGEDLTKVKEVCNVLLKEYQVKESKVWYKEQEKAEKDKLKREEKKEK